MIEEGHRLHEQRERSQFDRAVGALLDRVGTEAAAPVTRRREPDPVSDTPGDPAGVWWSHTPIMGYRIWQLRDGRLRGAWTPWETSRKTAVCLDPHSRATGPVPHEAADCRHPPCGIYALKTTRRAQVAAERSIRRATVPLTLAIGLVGMTGRVIEHESGYRAQHASVVGLAMITGGPNTHHVLAMIEGADAVAAAFTDPVRARRPGTADSLTAADAVVAAVRFLEETARARRP
jgi:hypothetical protein